MPSIPPLREAPLIRLPGSMQASALSSFTAVVPRPCERGSSPVPAVGSCQALSPCLCTMPWAGMFC